MIQLALAKWTILLLILVRVMGMFSTAPFWSGEGAPMVVKVGMAGAAALAIFPMVESKNLMPHTFTTSYAFAFEIMEQALIGMIIGFVCNMFFVVFDSSARFYDTQMGFGIINVIDPFHANEASIMAQLQSFIALLLFLAVDGPHLLLFAVQKSFVLVPHLSLNSGALPRAVFAVFSRVFYVSIVFVMPILGVLFITHLILGILSKASPQLNVMVLGFPINIAAGLFTFVLLLDYFQNMIPEIFATMFAEIDLFMVHLL